jgi:NAD(P)-dependent dehydrogenase (short-subunit alcohol dehydrogenase family)
VGFYTNKTVFLSGGSKGIGRETALQLAREGAIVTLAARGQAALDETLAAMKAIRDAPHRTVSVDIADAEAVKAAVDAAAEALGGLDVLICNAGYAQTGAAADAPVDQYQQLLDVNYLGHVHLARAAIPHLKRSKGHVCFVSSMLGFMSVYGYGAYSASKFAIAGFAEAVRQELLLDGVTVTVFYPPTTETPGLEAENEDKHPIIWAIESENSFTRTYTAEAVATGLLRSIASGRFESMVGWDSWLVFYARRIVPSVFRFLSDQELRTAARKVAENAPGTTET